jgi:hypothetical protein
MMSLGRYVALTARVAVDVRMLSSSFGLECSALEVDPAF